MPAAPASGDRLRRVAGGATARLLAGEGRLQLNHGPIDIVLEAEGETAAVERCHATARRRFRSVLEELVAELPLLRRPFAPAAVPRGEIARRMHAAVAPFADRFVTPMAAVAGAVADEIADLAWEAGGLDKLYVNNGGDIAFRLRPGIRFSVGLLPVRGERREEIHLAGRVELSAEDGVGGVATSGWRGRSLSLGVADAVTVLAATAARADAAATVIASAVDVESPAITRRPAREIDPDSDLGNRLVTVEVGGLSEAECCAALARGGELARAALGRGDVAGVSLALRGRVEVLGLAP